MKELENLLESSKKTSCLILDFLDEKNLTEFEVFFGLLIAVASCSVSSRGHRTIDEKIKTDCMILEKLMRELDATGEKLKAEGKL